MANGVRLSDLIPDNTILNPDSIIIRNLGGGTLNIAANKNGAILQSQSNQKPQLQLEIPFTIENGKLIVNIGALPEGSTVTVSYEVELDSGAENGNIITSQGTVSSTDTASKETKEDVVIGRYSLLYSEMELKDSNGGGVEPGEKLEYIIRIENTAEFTAIARAEDTSEPVDKELSGQISKTIQPGAAPGNVGISGETGSLVGNLPEGWIVELWLGNNKLDLDFNQAQAGEYIIEIDAPAGYLEQIPSRIIEPLLDPEIEAFDPTGLASPLKVVNFETAPASGEATDYYLAFELKAGVEILSITGEIITTDENGRYHLLLANNSGNNRGKTIVLKVNKSSLPGNAKIISKNP